MTKMIHKLFMVLVLAILVAGIVILSSGCGRSGRSENESDMSGNSAIADKPIEDDEHESEDNSLNDILSGLSGLVDEDDLQDTIDLAMSSGDIRKKGWPTDILPSQIPEYTSGEVVNSGGEANDYTILVDDTDRDELDEYLTLLEESGWYVERGRWPYVKKVNVSMEFQFNSDTMLQISVYVQEPASWPEDTLPEDYFPPETGTLIGEIVIIDNGDDYSEAYYFSYEYSGLTEVDVNEYIQELINSGWEGDEYMLSKEIQWMGKKFDAYIEPMEDNGNTMFYCNLWEIAE